MAAKRKLSAMNAVVDSEEEPVDPSDQLMFLCLGGGNEVGRSCHIIQYKGKTVMLDAGMHPAYEGLAALPFYDEFDLSTVDILLISHFHIDHAASLPYVLSKTNFRGRVFMTHATKAIYKWLIQDSVRVGNTASSSEQRTQIYTEADHSSTFPRIEAIDYYSTHTISSIRITPYPAGHVLGAAMFLVEIAGLNILFTGDYSRELDRHLIPAQVPKNVKVDIMITESTYGVSSHIPRLEREASLMKTITAILNRGGRALLPVFALGRAQELLLILDEYWSKHAEYRKFPIYYASNLARKCMQIYQSYISAMNDNIKKLFRERTADAAAVGSTDVTKGGPWDFKYVRGLKSLERFDDIGGCVMLASPGMMQNGPSRELLEKWAPDQRNGVVITGYSVEGTMAKLIVKEPDTIQAIMTKNAPAAGIGTSKSKDGDHVLIPRRCSVDEYSFAAHVDGKENQEFIELIDAPVVILVHGEKHNMTRLRSKLLSLNNSKPAHLKTKVFSPANCKELFIPVQKEKTAKIIGKLADKIVLPEHLSSAGLPKKLAEDGQSPKFSDGEVISGVLVQNNFNLSLMDPEDLREHAGLTTTTITCRMTLTLAGAGPELVRWALENSFGGVKELTAAERVKNENESKAEKAINGDHKDEQNEDMPSFKKSDSEEEKVDEFLEQSTVKFLVMDTVTVTYQNQGEVVVEWEGSMLNDGIADSIIEALEEGRHTQAAVKHSGKLHAHAHEHNHAHAHGQLNGADEKGTSVPTPEELARLMMLIEEQFGADNVIPISKPRVQTPNPDVEADDSPDKLTASERAELERIHALGLPVPGILVRYQQAEAKIWLEDRSVECDLHPLKDRILKIMGKSEAMIGDLWNIEAPKE